MIGKLTRITNDNIKNKLRSPELTKAELFDIVNDFIQGVKENNYQEKGFPKSIYGISKVGINHYAKVLANFESIKSKNVQVYAMCPGYVNTDMTSHKGHLTIQEGALTAVYLAELPFKVDPELQGKFFERSALSSLE